MAPKKDAKKPAKKAVTKAAPKAAPKAASKAQKKTEAKPKKIAPKKKETKPTKVAKAATKAAKKHAKVKKADRKAQHGDGKHTKTKVKKGPKGRNWSFGKKLPPRVDMRHFVRWPKFVTRQRMKRVLLKRLKVPPAINQFSFVLSDGARKELFALCQKYTAWGKKDHRRWRRQEAERKAADSTAQPGEKPSQLAFGLQRVTRMIQNKRAKLVLIAHDVDKLELVMWLPALCHKMGVPYCIVKSKSKLGTFCKQKQAAVVAFYKIDPADESKFEKLVTIANAQFSEKYDDRMKHWGGLQKRKPRVLSKREEKRKTLEKEKKARSAEPARKKKVEKVEE